MIWKTKREKYVAFGNVDCNIIAFSLCWVRETDTNVFNDKHCHGHSIVTNETVQLLLSRIFLSENWRFLKDSTLSHYIINMFHKPTNVRIFIHHGLASQHKHQEVSIGWIRTKFPDLLTSKHKDQHFNTSLKYGKCLCAMYG